MCSHIKIKALACEEASAIVDTGNRRNDKRVGVLLHDSVFAEMAFIYMDKIPKMVEEMRLRRYSGDDSATDIEDAW